MDSGAIQKHISETYVTMRRGLAYIAIAFPILLGLGGLLQGLELQGSLSAYYHAGSGLVRDWFVGLLFAIGVVLYLYKGFNDKENIALNFAGIFALAIAIFPMEQNCGDSCSLVTLHGISTFIFFACIAFVCIFCAEATLGELHDSGLEASYLKWYRLQGAGMIVFPVAAFLANIFAKNLVIIAEALSIWVFASYWLVKTRELQTTANVLGKETVTENPV